MSPIAKLDNRSAIHVTGDDRSSFLQGLISNDISLCTPEKPIYAALLTPQGKFLYDLFIYENDGVFLIDCEAARSNDLISILHKHKLRAKVNIDSAPDYNVYAMWDGEVAPGWFTDPRLSFLGFRSIQKKTQTNANFNAYDKHRLTHGVPDGSRDMEIEKSTLLECNMDRLNAISWTKGCYMGQELTARMHYRGIVKKRLYPVMLQGPAPAPGTLIGDAGEMRSSCDITGIALLNIEKAGQAIKDRKAFEVGASQLMPYAADWMKD
jgi:tRNA-modifying protein YgfZ